MLIPEVEFDQIEDALDCDPELVARVVEADLDAEDNWLEVIDDEIWPRPEDENDCEVPITDDDGLPVPDNKDPSPELADETLPEVGTTLVLLLEGETFDCEDTLEVGRLEVDGLTQTVTV